MLDFVTMDFKIRVKKKSPPPTGLYNMHIERKEAIAHLQINGALISVPDLSVLK